MRPIDACWVHADPILRHYNDAREKHPYFCDKITNFDSSEKVGLRLDECRSEIRYTALNGTVVPRVLLNCEWLEAIEAYLRGNKAQAVEELYDCIAVCLRTIDVIEGRQKLGKPQTISGNDAEK